MHMYTSDPNPVPVTYDNQELLGIVDKYLSEMDGEFSYKGVCRYVVNEAKRNDKVEGAPHTKYSSSDIRKLNFLYFLYLLHICSFIVFICSFFLASSNASISFITLSCALNRSFGINQYLSVKSFFNSLHIL